MNEDIYQSRLDGLIERAEYYLYLNEDGLNWWSKGQQEDIKEIADTICFFGEVGKYYANELLQIV